MTSRRLAQFIALSRWEDVPAFVRHEAKRSLVNFVGAALGGCSDEATSILAETSLRFSGPAAATLIGRGERADMLTAAFVNAAAGNVFDFDDTHPGTIIHPTAPVAPALFALAESRPVSGAELLHAFVLGVDVECRLGNAVSPWHYKRGWHITSTCGVFGAAAASARVLGLDEERTLWALGAASSQASGLIETLGTMAKSFGVGQSARGGLLGALLAEAGLRGPEQPVEGPRGFLGVMGQGADHSCLTAGLGVDWEMSRNTYKPYPCGVVLNPVIDACLALRAAHVIDPSEIAEVVVSGHPLLRERADRPDVSTGRSAQVSAQHAVAVALLDGAAGVAEFSDARVHSPDVLDLRSRVRVEVVEGVSVDGARVAIELRSGERCVHDIAAARGSSARPLDDREIDAKFRTLAAHGCPGFDPEPLLAALWSLEESPDAGGAIHLAAAFV